MLVAFIGGWCLRYAKEGLRKRKRKSSEIKLEKEREREREREQIRQILGDIALLGRN